MRIIAGTHRGRALTPVGRGDAGAHLRPTSDRVREALFNTLAGGRFGDPITGAQVLDVFAGTGALGLEALSRGAAHATFIDSGRVAGGLIRRNIALLDVAGACTLIGRDARKLGEGTAHDLIFLDPPYGKGLAAPVLMHLAASGWLAPGALVVVEESGPLPAPQGFAVLDNRRYGDTQITFLQAEG